MTSASESTYVLPTRPRNLGVASGRISDTRDVSRTVLIVISLHHNLSDLASPRANRRSIWIGRAHRNQWVLLYAVFKLRHYLQHRTDDPRVERRLVLVLLRVRVQIEQERHRQLHRRRHHRLLLVRRPRRRRSSGESRACST